MSVRGGCSIGGLKKMEEEIKTKAIEDKEKLIRKEKTKLNKIFKNINKDRLKVVEKLIDSASFMSVTLQDLEKEINKNGTVSEYKNGENQYGTKKSPEVEVYNTMVKNYTSIIKQLLDQLPQSESDPLKDGGELAEFILK